jgi:hypothetical protein
LEAPFEPPLSPPQGAFLAFRQADEQKSFGLTSPSLAEIKPPDYH